MKVDVIIPVYGPGNRLLELFDRLGHQTVPVDRLIVMNTEKSLWDKWTGTLEPGRLPENLTVYHVTKETFDHGATRNAGIEHSDADVCVCMTHDALPADTGLLKALTDALFAEKDIAVAYARQLPAKDCNIIERHTREFNYPDKSRIKTRRMNLPTSIAAREPKRKRRASMNSSSPSILHRKNIGIRSRNNLSGIICLDRFFRLESS